MATYETGSANNLQDLADKLLAFAVTYGWTLDDHFDAAVGQLTLLQAGCFMSFRWH